MKRVLEYSCALCLACFLGLGFSCAGLQIAAAQSTLNHDTPRSLPVLQPSSGPPSLLAYFENHCRSCHNSSLHEGNLDLSQVRWQGDQNTILSLTRIYDRVKSLEMPPQEELQPTDEERREFLNQLSKYTVAIDRERIASVGRAMKRRLNRYEYENSLRDLLSLPWLSIRESLPEDGELYRYNKSGEALDVSHVQLSRYLNAADNALQQALLSKWNRPERTKKRFYARDEMSLVGNFWPRENGTLPDRLSFPVLDSHAQPEVRSGESPKSSIETRDREAVGRVSSIFSDAGGYSWSQFRVPASGRYRLKFKGYSIWVSGGGIGRWFYEGFGEQKAPVYHLPLWHRPNADEVWPGKRSEPIGVYAQSSGKSRSIGSFDFGVEPTECEIETILTANEVIQTDGMRLFRTRVNGTDEQYVNPLATESGMPGYAIQWMEVDGPIDDERIDAGFQLLFGDLPMQPIADGTAGGYKLKVPAAPALASSTPGTGALRQNTPRGPGLRGSSPRFVDVLVEVKSENPRRDAELLLDKFLAQAYVHPVDTTTRTRFMKLFDQQLEQGVGFANAMVTVYTAVLASPGYLFTEEPPGSLDGLSIANRLSLFLWNTKSDSQLKSLANSNDLLKPHVLRREVERMLQDSKSRRFVDAFTDYWLDLRKMNDTSPSTTLYNDYELDEPLQAAALEETRLFFAKVIADDLPVRTFVDSDFTYLNERLSDHYGIDGVQGAVMRLVKLPRNSVRGGVMTQASVLKVTANGTTTSPVVRGNWISERIFGMHLAPPPSVPAVEPDIRGAVTIREQLDRHRNNASCASCHAKIDPPGFALEAFDVMGGFRERYRAVVDGAEAQKGVGMNGQAFAFRYGLPVDCSGTLQDGRPFTDIRELKKLLIQEERAIARNLANQFVVYATGASIGFADRLEIEEILDQLEPTQFQVRSLIHAIVQSPLFLSK